MPNSHAAINPRLICTITGQAPEHVTDKPTFDMLPGSYARLVARRKNRFRPIHKPNKHYLVCGHCGRKGQYDLGLVLFDANRWLADREKQGSTNSGSQIGFLDYIQATAYFRCKHCNKAGKWEDVSNSIGFRIMAGVLADRQGRGSGYSTGEIILFDGSRHRWASDAEEHFLQKLQKTGHDGYLWNRLGNLYYQAGRPELAAVALEQSVRVDPAQMESHYSLGNLLEHIGETEKAAYHFRMMLTYARFYKQLEAAKMRDMLAAGLQNLFNIHLESRQMTPFLPTEEEFAVARESAGQGDDHSDVSELMLVDLELDPADRDSFKPLAEMFMGSRREKLPVRQRTLDKHLPGARQSHKQKEALQPPGHFTSRARLTNGRTGVPPLGSEQRPVVIDVNSEERGNRIAQICDRLGLHYVIRFSLMEDLTDLKQAVLDTLVPEDPYQPCPCGSGRKFKFCCAKKMKTATVDQLLAFVEEA